MRLRGRGDLSFGRVIYIAARVARLHRRPNAAIASSAGAKSAEAVPPSLEGLPEGLSMQTFQTATELAAAGYPAIPRQSSSLGASVVVDGCCRPMSPGGT